LFLEVVSTLKFAIAEKNAHRRLRPPGEFDHASEATLSVLFEED
jgi:hypothetical protein